jgi:hypothetical protein
MIDLLCEMGDYLGSFYNIYVEKNIEVIEKGYNIMSNDFNIKGMKSFLNYMKRTVPSNIDIREGQEYTIYFFDSFEKIHKKSLVKFEKDISDRINGMTNIEKCLYFLDL